MAAPTPLLPDILFPMNLAEIAEFNILPLKIAPPNTVALFSLNSPKISVREIISIFIAPPLALTELLLNLAEIVESIMLVQ